LSQEKIKDDEEQTDHSEFDLVMEKLWDDKSLLLCEKKMDGVRVWGTHNKQFVAPECTNLASLKINCRALLVAPLFPRFLSTSFGGVA